MFRLSSLTRRTTASLLLLVFLHLLVGQCLCAALGVPMPRGAHAAAAKPAPRDAHACCKKFSKLKKRLADRKPAKPGHDCCKDKSTALLKALDTPPAKPLLDAPAVLALPPVHSFAFARFVAWDAAAPVVLVSRQHLPPKIPDIRVFLRSLTV